MSSVDLTCSAGWLFVQAVRFGNTPNPAGRQRRDERERAMQAQCSATVYAWAMRRSVRQAFFLQKHFVCFAQYARVVRSRFNPFGATLCKTSVSLFAKAIYVYAQSCDVWHAGDLLFAKAGRVFLAVTQAVVQCRFDSFGATLRKTGGSLFAKACYV